MGQSNSKSAEQTITKSVTPGIPVSNPGATNLKTSTKKVAQITSDIKVGAAPQTTDTTTDITDRDKLMRIAATFLANPNIEKESMELKTAFLRRKGLTDEEIKRSFDLYKEKIRMQQEEKELKEELESLKSGGKSKKGNEKLIVDIQNRIERAKKTGFLSLKEFGLDEIPKEIFEIENLHTLILSNNPVKMIPPEIASLKNLKSLHMASCELFDDSIPEQLSSLQLEELILSNNGLTNFDKLTGLFSLKRLNLSSNEILSLPADV